MGITPWLKRIYSAEGLLFLTVFACAVYFSEIAYQTSNYTARLFLMEAVVDHGTFLLDAYEETLGVDGAIFEGHLYSNKPPGSSLMMLPQYLLLGKPVKWLFETLDINVTVQNQDYAVQDVLAGWLVQIFSLGVYSAVGFVAFYRILGLLGVGHRFLLTLLAFFGTLMFAYATIGVGEMYTAPPLLLGVYYLLKSRLAPQPEEPKSIDANYIWAGFWYGLAFFVTTQALLVVGTAALALLWATRNLRPLFLFLLPVAVFVALTLGYNWYLFDSPFAFPVSFWAQGNPEVVLLEWPTLPKLVDMLFLPWKGIFFYSPYLALSLPGFYYLYRRLPGEKRYRQGVVILLAGSFLAYFIFLFFNVGWFGGADFGFRYVVPALPFLAIGAAVWADKRPRNPLVWLFIVWSIAVCTFGAITDPEVPTGVPNPLYYYNGPLFLERATNNVPNLLFEQLFDVNNWLLRFATTFLFFAVLAFLLWRSRGVWREGREV